MHTQIRKQQLIEKLLKTSSEDRAPKPSAWLPPQEKEKWSRWMNRFVQTITIICSSGVSGVAVSRAVRHRKARLSLSFRRRIISSCRQAHNTAPGAETSPERPKVKMQQTLSITSYHGHQGSTRDVRLGGAACNSRDSPCLRVKNSRGDMPCRSRLSRSFTGGSR